MKKKLIELLSDLEKYDYKGKDIEVTGIAVDSRKVKKGNLFVAVKGLTVDGHDFIDQAIKKGASAIVGEAKPKKKWLKKVTYIKVSNSSKVLGVIASKWFNDPSRKMKVIGVTGTDGKTTTVNLIYHILKSSGKKVGMISTISAKIGNKEYDTGFHVTTPEAIETQRFLSKMVDAKCEYAVIEVTSHGIDQGRIEGVDFDIAVLTNITKEHLDYHGSWKKYRDSKLKLIRKADVAVINKDDKSFRYISKKKNKVASYSIADKSADIYTKSLKTTSRGSSFTVVSHDTQFSTSFNLASRYNVSNALAAIATCALLGIKPAQIASALSKVKVLSGRLEEVKNDKGFRTIVDFAHTPNSLEEVLKELSKQTTGKLISVFGCASERDDRKRPIMAEISTRIADVSIFTAEDPRNEDINKIIQAMAEGVGRKVKELKAGDDLSKQSKGNWYMRIPERGEAVAFAIQKLARKGDTVVVCGKGHEKSMAYGGVEYAWSDQGAVRMALGGKTKVIERK